MRTAKEAMSTPTLTASRLSPARLASTSRGCRLRTAATICSHSSALAATVSTRRPRRSSGGCWRVARRTGRAGRLCVWVSITLPVGPAGLGSVERILWGQSESGAPRRWECWRRATEAANRRRRWRRRGGGGALTGGIRVGRHAFSHLVHRHAVRQVMPLDQIATTCTPDELLSHIENSLLISIKCLHLMSCRECRRSWVQIPQRAKYVFHILLHFMKWNVKNCFVKLIWA